MNGKRFLIFVAIVSMLIASTVYSGVGYAANEINASLNGLPFDEDDTYVNFVEKDAKYYRTYLDIGGNYTLPDLTDTAGIAVRIRNASARSNSPIIFWLRCGSSNLAINAAASVYFIHGPNSSVAADTVATITTETGNKFRLQKGWDGTLLIPWSAFTNLDPTTVTGLIFSQVNDQTDLMSWIMGDLAFYNAAYTLGEVIDTKNAWCSVLQSNATAGSYKLSLDALASANVRFTVNGEDFVAGGATGITCDRETLVMGNAAKISVSKSAGIVTGITANGTSMTLSNGVYSYVKTDNGADDLVFNVKIVTLTELASLAINDPLDADATLVNYTANDGKVYRTGIKAPSDASLPSLADTAAVALRFRNVSGYRRPFIIWGNASGSTALTVGSTVFFIHGENSVSESGTVDTLTTASGNALYFPDGYDGTILIPYSSFTGISAGNFTGLTVSHMNNQAAGTLNYIVGDMGFVGSDYVTVSKAETTNEWVYTVQTNATTPVISYDALQASSVTVTVNGEAYVQNDGYTVSVSDESLYYGEKSTVTVSAPDNIIESVSVNGRKIAFDGAYTYVKNDNTSDPVSVEISLVARVENAIGYAGKYEGEYDSKEGIIIFCSILDYGYYSERIEECGVYIAAKDVHYEAMQIGVDGKFGIFFYGIDDIGMPDGGWVAQGYIRVGGIYYYCDALTFGHE